MAKNVVINTIVSQNVPEVDIPISGGGTAKFFDTSGSDLVAGDLLNGKKGYGANGEVVGNMANNGAVSGQIETKAGTVTVPAGYTSGGTVSIDSSAVADLVSGNLLAGKSVLGVDGALTTVNVSQDGTSKILSIS